jgi:hypothetical protein
MVCHFILNESYIGIQVLPIPGMSQIQTNCEEYYIVKYFMLSFLLVETPVALEDWMSWIFCVKG